MIEYLLHFHGNSSLSKGERGQSIDTLTQTRAVGFCRQLFVCLFVHIYPTLGCYCDLLIIVQGVYYFVIMKLSTLYVKHRILVFPARSIEICQILQVASKVSSLKQTPCKLLSPVFESSLNCVVGCKHFINASYS
jgi:hypothetical protein